MDVTDTLQERGARYGDFAEHARIAQLFQDDMRGVNQGRGWDRLSDVQKQALTVIADKIARILSGDPSYADSWHDIGGYAKLVENYIESGFVTCLPVQQTLPLGEYEDYPSGVMIDAWTADAFRALFGPSAVQQPNHLASYCHSDRVIKLQVNDQEYEYRIP